MPEGIRIIIESFFYWSFSFCSWCFLTSCRNIKVIRWDQTWVYKCFIGQLCTMQDSFEATDCFKWKHQGIVGQARMSWICNTFNLFAIYINFCHLRFGYNRDLITFVLFKFLIKLNMELFKFISEVAILVRKIKLVISTS